MPHGKPAGVACVHLRPDYACALFGQPTRPTFCKGLQAQLEMCGNDRASALHTLTRLEKATRPD